MVGTDEGGKYVNYLILRFVYHSVFHTRYIRRLYSGDQVTTTFPLHTCTLIDIIIIIYYLKFFTSALADDLSMEIKWPQVSRTLLSILAVLNNAVVWMISTRPPASKSSSPFNNPLVIIPKASIAIGIIVTSMFQSFFLFPSKVEVLILLFTFSNHCLLKFHKVASCSFPWKSSDNKFSLLFQNTPRYACEFFIPVLADGFTREFEW